MFWTSIEEFEMNHLFVYLKATVPLIIYSIFFRFSTNLSGIVKNVFLKSSQACWCRTVSRSFKFFSFLQILNVTIIYNLEELSQKISKCIILRYSLTQMIRLTVGLSQSQVACEPRPILSSFHGDSASDIHWSSWAQPLWAFP